MNEPRLRIRDVTKRFGAAAVLRGVDLDLHGGEATGFMGEKGDARQDHRWSPFRHGWAHGPRSDAIRSCVAIARAPLRRTRIENLMIDRLCQGWLVWFAVARSGRRRRRWQTRVGLDVPLGRGASQLRSPTAR